MIKKKKIPIKSLVLILILVELICLVFADPMSRKSTN